MKIGKRFKIPNDCPTGISDEIITNQTRSILVSLVSYVVPDRYYKIRLGKEKTFSPLDDSTAYYLTLEYDQVPEKIAVYRSPEELNLVPETSTLNKLKNCIKYLRDKTGGKLEFTEKT